MNKHRELPKLCTVCKTSLDEAKWRSLKLIGYSVSVSPRDESIIVIELRNHQCFTGQRGAATLSIEALPVEDAQHVAMLIELLEDCIDSRDKEGIEAITKLMRKTE